MEVYLKRKSLNNFYLLIKDGESGKFVVLEFLDFNLFVCWLGNR